MSRHLMLGPEARLGIADVAAVAAGRLAVTVAEPGWQLLQERHEQLLEAAADGVTIYGLNTGFGPLADRAAGGDAAQMAATQRGLIAHLATGVGEPLGPEAGRAITLARLHVLARGESGASPGVVAQLMALLEADVAPAIPALGSVGASGDLTPLAHLALALMGEGEVWWRSELREAGEAFAEAGLRPWEPAARDGLAIVNGTSVTAALAALASARMRDLLDRSITHAVAYAECLGGRREAFHALPAERRPHGGQLWVQAELAQRASDSLRLVEASGAGSARGTELPQDAYTLRCVQQVLGAVADVLRQHDELVEVELNAITDNPLLRFPAEAGQPIEVVHAGNFMGLHLGFALDHLHNALVALAAFIERRINRLTHPLLNGELPAFLTGATAGPSSGLMGAQVTATALVAELRTRAMPASVQSIATNGDNQDFVPMATIGARRLLESLKRLQELLAIESIALAQAVDLGGGPASGYAATTRALHEAVRRVSPPLTHDRPLSPEIRRLARTMG